MTWKRIAFEPFSDEHLLATQQITDRADTYLERLLTDHRSIWAVDRSMSSVAEQLGEPSDEVPADIDLSKAYIYFSPGTYEALRDVLPSHWQPQSCVRPPRQLVSGMVLKDDDFNHWFGRQQGPA